MPLDDVNFAMTKNASIVATCKQCGMKASHLSSTGTYQDVYPVTEDGSYDTTSNTFTCWNCFRKN